MNAAPILIRVARVLRETGLEAVMIGNAAAALQGAPVTTIDVDFLFRKTPANLRKLKAVARAFDAVVFKQYYPPADYFRIYADDQALQMGFTPGSSAARRVIEVEGEKILVEQLNRKMVKTRRRIVRATGRYSMPSPKRSKNRKPTRREKLEALKLESELALRDQIRRLLAKPPGERTHFLRKRIGIGSTCL